MYNKKYILMEIDSKTNNPVHDDIKGKICYLAYFTKGERGWFLCEVDSWFSIVNRIHTSVVKEVWYTEDDEVIVETQNTKYVFRLYIPEEEIGEESFYE